MPVLGGWINLKIDFVSGEKLSSDESAVQRFKENVKQNSLLSDQIYNAHKSLFWRMLPNKSVISSKGTSAPGHIVSNDKITFMSCSNATEIRFVSNW